MLKDRVVVAEIMLGLLGIAAVLSGNDGVIAAVIAGGLINLGGYFNGRKNE